MTRILGVSIVLTMALLLGATAVMAAPASLVSRGPTNSRTIALTFDDGSSPARCESIYDTLVRHDIPATWFPNAVYMSAAPKLWRKIAKRFPLANHTTHHRSLATASRQQIRDEISSHERRVEALTGEPMSKLLRPPYGAWDQQVLKEAGRLGYSRVVLWDVSSADTSTRGTDRGVTKAAMRGGPGSIILMHCGPAVTPRILPIVIARYACKGFRFADVEQLLAGGEGVEAKGVTCPPPKLPARGATATKPAGSGTAREPTRSGRASTLGAKMAGRTWRLTDATDHGDLVSTEVGLTFRWDGKQASGTLGCDEYTVAIIEKSDGRLKFGRLWRSTNACTDDPGPDASRLLDKLVASTGGRIVDDALELLDDDGAVVLRFAPSTAVDPIGEWTVVAMAAEGDTLADVPGAATMTARFLPTGAVRGSTACSDYRGGFSLAGSSISIGPLMTPGTSCDESAAATAERYLAALEAAAGWSLLDDTLALRDAGDQILLELRPRVASDDAPAEDTTVTTDA